MLNFWSGDSPVLGADVRYEVLQAHGSFKSATAPIVVENKKILIFSKP